MEFLEGPEFWVFVAFVIFVALVWKPISIRIVGALDGRAAKIRADLEQAHGLREDAQKLLADYQRRQRDAGKEAEAILARAREEAERLRKQALVDLDERIARRERLAEEKISQAEAAALKEVRDRAVDLAIAATRKLLVERLDAERRAALLDKAIAELPERLN